MSRHFNTPNNLPIFHRVIRDIKKNFLQPIIDKWNKIEECVRTNNKITK